MSKPLIYGVKGSKPRSPGKQKRAPIAALPKEEGEALTRAYLLERNKREHLRNLREQLALAKEKKLLVPIRQVEVQAGYLLTELRQSLLTLAPTLAQRLGHPDNHAIIGIIRETISEKLADVAKWPPRIVDPDWLGKIDEDLMPLGSNGVKGAVKAKAKGKPRKPG
jgi:hypothetical protein